MIKENKSTKYQKFKTQKHHILPRCYYTRNNIIVDDSEENTVYLSTYNHMVAHYYLALCTNGYMKHLMCGAFLFITSLNKESLNKDLFELEETLHNISEIKETYFRNKPKFTDEQKRNLSLGHKGKMRWMTNGEISKQVKIEDIEDYLNKGFVFGRQGPSKEAREKIRNTLSGRKASQDTLDKRNKLYYTNPEYCKKLSESHLGYKVSKEAKEKLSKTNKGKHFFNNGIINVFTYECPPGFKPGMLHKLSKEELHERLSKAQQKVNHATNKGKVVVYIDRRKKFVYLETLNE